jgi:nucleoside-diphosphate-sugar epimerase
VKVAITGASGFIGRHILAELLARSVEIVAVTRDAGKLEALRDRIEIIEADIGSISPGQLDRLSRSDMMIHLAWDGLPHYNARHHFETELPKQYEFLKALVMRGLPALLVTGTCLEYGLQSGELSETSLALPTTPYGFAKDCLRRQMEFLKRDHAFAMTWTRLFYTFGEGQSASSLYSQLMAATSRGDMSFDMSVGEQLRDYLPIAELARLIVDLAMRQADAGLLNVCSGKPISVRRLVESWAEERDSNIRLNLGRYSCPDYESLAFWGSRRKLDTFLEQL